ncbi:MAG: hypothetical protein LUQ16_06540 [Methanomassiliicoccales archaeon]|nr:hypothetical protein [Methanomassiliicoccales archaeon]
MRDRLALILPTALIVAAEAAFFQGLLTTSLSVHLVNIFLCVVLVIVTKRSRTCMPPSSWSLCFACST